MAQIYWTYEELLEDVHRRATTVDGSPIVAARCGGNNLMDLASVTYGLAFGTEMGMFGTFDGRVDLALTTVRTAVSVFEQRYT